VTPADEFGAIPVRYVHVEDHIPAVPWDSWQWDDPDWDVAHAFYRGAMFPRDYQRPRWKVTREPVVAVLAAIAGFWAFLFEHPWLIFLIWLAFMLGIFGTVLTAPR
jgi:hypothetical protein